MSTDAARDQALDSHAHGKHGSTGLLRLALGALGVVYGDIGTSPLYAVKECFTAPHGVPADVPSILGVLSLILWALTLVIVVKYASFVLRADNHGEGGTLALLALLTPRSGEARDRRYGVLVGLGLFGTSLLYGEGLITPAISVLSAVEGLDVATDRVHAYIVPLTVAILLALFLGQRRGTARVGAVFGPITLAWFLSIAAAGLPWIVRRPEVLGALNPVHAVRFFLLHRLHGFLVLGSVVLCITGGEALYADLGHFGRRPIRLAWFSVAFPALALNYLGQGAWLLDHPEGGGHPFFGLVPRVFVVPLVLLATAATVVASQAMISGAFSLTQQAVQLGYFPRVTIVHTSEESEGQIYVPEINNFLMVSCIALVLVFQQSSRLAAAYGIAVTGAMSITSILLYHIARRRWGWRRWTAAGLTGTFLLLDLSFFGANLVKVLQGGWLPLLVGAGMFAIMTTWKRGRAALGRYFVAVTLPLEGFLASVREEKPHRVRGTAVFMTSNVDGAPPVLLHHYKHNQVLHQQVVLLSVVTEHDPTVPSAARVEVSELGEGFFKVVARYGFLETPNVMEVLELCRDKGLQVDRARLSFFLGRETLLTTGSSGLPRWRKALFVLLSRNARPANMFFRIPPNRVVELGTQVEL
ncbi:MAG: potassium transporter Kup [Deltaproteobacteria bacterium]|nr:potassium transporter Kup [Deltaproteobacteria bacterium]